MLLESPLFCSHVQWDKLVPFRYARIIVWQGTAQNLDSYILNKISMNMEFLNGKYEYSTSYTLYNTHSLIKLIKSNKWIAK